MKTLGELLLFRDDFTYYVETDTDDDNPNIPLEHGYGRRRNLVVTSENHQVTVVVDLVDRQVTVYPQYEREWDEIDRFDSGYFGL